MNLGAWMCIVLALCFAVFGLLFGILKERAAIFVSGFNTLPKEERKLYDRAHLARDMRNMFYLWAVVMLVGAAGAWLLTGFFAAVAYLVWIVLFFREVHLDARKAFEKYKIK